MKNKVSILHIAICVAISSVLFFNQTVMGKQCIKEIDQAKPKVGKVIDLPQPNSLDEDPILLNKVDSTAFNLTINLGDAVRYSAPVHFSVGSEYTMECDKTAFDIDCSTLYDHPEDMEMGMCGADSAMQIYTLRPLKKGEFIVKAIHDFRGDIERVITYTIVVNEFPE